jgi:hypothetical protein
MEPRDEEDRGALPETWIASTQVPEDKREIWADIERFWKTIDRAALQIEDRIKTKE